MRASNSWCSLAATALTGKDDRGILGCIMSDSPLISEDTRRNYVRRLGNPYAVLGLEGFDEEGRLAEPELMRKRAWLRRSGNPYAALELFDDIDTPSPAPTTIATAGAAPRPDTQVLPLEDDAHTDELFTLPPAPRFPTKTRFESECRRIFNQYQPAVEGRRTLKEPYRRFIAEHSSRSGQARAKILEELTKYDLSALGPEKAYFNREGREDFLLRKLDQITRRFSEDS